MLAVEQMVLEENEMLRNEGRSSGIDEGKRIGIDEGKRIGIIKVAKYNVPINVDTIKEGYPILCA